MTEKDKQRNTERREWYKAHHICPKCGQNAAFGKFVQCEVCLEKTALSNLKYADKQPEYEARRRPKRKQQYEERKATGICTVCGKHDAVNGQLCTECWNRRRKRREKEKVERKRPGEHFRERVSAGICMYCCEPVVEGYCFCEKHLPGAIESGRRCGKSHSTTWRTEISAGWELAKAIHRRKNGDTDD